MLNGFEIQAGAVAPATYAKIDGLCLFLCKECLAGVPKLELPEHLTSNGLLEALNLLYSREDFLKFTETF